MWNDTELSNKDFNFNASQDNIPTPGIDDNTINHTSEGALSNSNDFFAEVGNFLSALWNWENFISFMLFLWVCLIAFWAMYKTFKIYIQKEDTFVNTVQETKASLILNITWRAILYTLSYFMTLAGLWLFYKWFTYLFNYIISVMHYGL